MEITRYVYIVTGQRYRNVAPPGHRPEHVAEPCDVEITIDLEQIGRDIARAAISNTSGRTSARYGAIKGRVIR